MSQIFRGAFGGSNLGLVPLGCGAAATVVYVPDDIRGVSVRMTAYGIQVAAKYNPPLLVTQIGVQAIYLPDTFHARLSFVGRQVMTAPVFSSPPGGGGGRPMIVRPLFDASRIINRKGL